MIVTQNEPERFSLAATDEEAEDHLALLEAGHRQNIRQLLGAFYGYGVDAEAKANRAYLGVRAWLESQEDDWLEAAGADADYVWWAFARGNVVGLEALHAKYGDVVKAAIRREAAGIYGRRQADARQAEALGWWVRAA